MVRDKNSKYWYVIKVEANQSGRAVVLCQQIESPLEHLAKLFQLENVLLEFIH